MASTEHTFRILCIARADRAAAVAAWLNANVSPNEVPAGLGPGLSATGAAPATHNWFCGAYRDSEAQAILSRLCTLAGVAPPAWSGWDRPAKVAWLKGVQQSLWTGWAIGCDLMPNEFDWDDTIAEAAKVGLKPIP